MFMAKYTARASPSAFGISPDGGDKSGVNLLMLKGLLGCLGSLNVPKDARVTIITFISVMTRFFKPLPLVLMGFLHSGAHLIAKVLPHATPIPPVEMTVPARGTFDTPQNL